MCMIITSRRCGAGNTKRSGQNDQHFFLYPATTSLCRFIYPPPIESSGIACFIKYSSDTIYLERQVSQILGSTRFSFVILTNQIPA